MVHNPSKCSPSWRLGRPPGVTPGTPLDAPMAINLPPLLLPPGQRFTWVLMLDGETHEDWQLALTTRPAPSQPDGGQLPPLQPPEQN
jgi:hypothetical protein